MKNYICLLILLNLVSVCANSQCVPRSVFNDARLTTSGGVVVFSPQPNTEYDLRINFSNAHAAYNSTSVQIDAADGIFAKIAIGNFRLIPDPVARDITTTSTVVVFRVKTFQAQDLGSFIYLRAKFTCVNGSGEVQQFIINLFNYVVRLLS